METNILSENRNIKQKEIYQSNQKKIAMRACWHMRMLEKNNLIETLELIGLRTQCVDLIAYSTQFKIISNQNTCYKTT